jgi:hypothetical protein
MAAIGVEIPSEQAQARSVDQPASGCPANYKNWNRDPAYLELQWSKRADGSCHRLVDVLPQQLSGQGVFVVWLSGGEMTSTAVLYVGRGSLRDELAKCRHDPLFRAERLYVAWATVDTTRLVESVAAYLYQRLRPMWGEAVYAPSTPVSLPLYCLAI